MRGLFRSIRLRKEEEDLLQVEKMVLVCNKVEECFPGQRTLKSKLNIMRVYLYNNTVKHQRK